MESPPPKEPPARKYTPISVGKCHVQTATDRFGPGAVGAIRDREKLALGMPLQGNEQPFTWPSDGQGDEGEDDQDHRGPRSIYNIVPSMQSNRNNLTALSQCYNLYFVAYQGCIFVYRLRSGAKHTLPRHPDLLLRPAASDQGRVVGGYLDERGGHSINHLMTGHLGLEEIVLAAYDDGDVIAYKTNDVASYVLDWEPATQPQSASHSCRGSKNKPRPFFHENVGKTAWGLAIHQQSRLIAITSNRCEVTVFAFALYGDSTRQPPSPELDEFSDDVEAWVRQRQRTWRIVILLGQEADNMPNVCFLNNSKGFAEKVCAIDIRGSVWIADIWKPNQPASRVTPFDGQAIISDEFYPAVSRGWGILAFTDSCYMEVNTIEELTGMSERRCRIKAPRFGLRQPLVNTEKSLDEIPDNPCPPSRSHWASVGNARPGNHLGYGFVSDETDDDDIDDDDDSDVMDDEDDGDDSNEIDDDDDDSDHNDFNDSGYAFMAELVSSSDEDSAPDADVTSIVSLQPMFQDEGQTLPHDLAAAAQQHEGTAVPPPHVLAQFPSEWPFQDTFQDLSEALEELEVAFGELQDAFPQFDFSPPSGSGQPEDPAKCSHFNCPSCRLSRQRTLERTPGMADGLLQMIYYPHSGEVSPAPMTRASRIAFVRAPRMSFNTNRPQPSAALDRLAPGYRILRAYEKDFEMWRLAGPQTKESREIAMFCGDAVNFQRFGDVLSSRCFRATSRLSLLAHVPELSLVVLGSPTGRVLVASLTRLSSRVADASGLWEWRRGIRVEWVLPRASEEEAQRRSRRALHGMAIGRIPDAGDRNGEQAGRGASLPRRYRLMLHYQNHDIFSYEVTRSEQTGKICMF